MAFRFEFNASLQGLNNHFVVIRVGPKQVAHLDAFFLTKTQINRPVHGKANSVTGSTEMLTDRRDDTERCPCILGLPVSSGSTTELTDHRNQAVLQFESLEDGLQGRRSGLAGCVSHWHGFNHA